MACWIRAGSSRLSSVSFSAPLLDIKCAVSFVHVAGATGSLTVRVSCANVACARHKPPASENHGKESATACAIDALAGRREKLIGEMRPKREANTAASRSLLFAAYGAGCEQSN